MIARRVANEAARGNLRAFTEMADRTEGKVCTENQLPGMDDQGLPWLDIPDSGSARENLRVLAAYLFTNDMNRIMRAVRDLECGELYINRGPGESIHRFHSGWKESGIGGDDGKHDLEHYLQEKTVYLRFEA
jgi:Aldehyde dehydrogenase family